MVPLVLKPTFTTTNATSQMDVSRESVPAVSAFEASEEAFPESVAASFVSEQMAMAQRLLKDIRILAIMLDVNPDTQTIKEWRTLLQPLCICNPISISPARLFLDLEAIISKIESSIIGQNGSKVTHVEQKEPGTTNVQSDEPKIDRKDQPIESQPTSFYAGHGSDKGRLAVDLAVLKILMEDVLLPRPNHL